MIHYESELFLHTQFGSNLDDTFVIVVVVMSSSWFS